MVHLRARIVFTGRLPMASQDRRHQEAACLLTQYHTDPDSLCRLKDLDRITRIVCHRILFPSAQVRCPALWSTCRTGLLQSGTTRPP